MKTPEQKKSCALCGENYKTCAHPWDKPFSDWPAQVKQDLLAVVPRFTGDV